MLPSRDLIRWEHADRLAPPLWVLGEGLEKGDDLQDHHTLLEGESPDLVGVQAVGQVAQDGVLLVGGNPLDDQLARGHADGEEIAVPEEL